MSRAPYSLQSRASARARRVVAEPHARLADRHDRGRDAAAVHVLDRALRRPVGERPLAGLAADHHVGDPARRREMMMHVDAVGLFALRGRGGNAEAERGAGRDAFGQESAPAQAACILRRRATGAASGESPARLGHGVSSDNRLVARS